MTRVNAPTLPETAIRARARRGTGAVFPALDGYGRTLFGASPRSSSDGAPATLDGGAPATSTPGGVRATMDSPAEWGVPDGLDALRIVPPVFVPGRLEKMFELGREPMYADVALDTMIGGFTAPLPVFLCAFGSTRAAGGDLGMAVSIQAGRLGLPMVIGENVVPMHGYGRLPDADPANGAGHTNGADTTNGAGHTNGADPANGGTQAIDAGHVNGAGPGLPGGLLDRIRAYAEAVPDGLGGVVVQQSTEDADAEVWNLVYSDPYATKLLATGRLAFELKVGQGAKPGLGGLTVMDRAAAAALRRRYTVDDALGEGDTVLRSSSPGTFTEEILRHQVRLMRNNYPRARVWVKLHPGRDIAQAAAVAWAAGADAVTVDGAEGGTGWAPTVFLDQVGLPLAECLRRLPTPPASASLNVSGRIWEGSRALKCLALGASAVGLGRAALLAVDEDPTDGLIRLVRCLEFELRLLISALGKYRGSDVGPQDLWHPGQSPGIERGVCHDEHSDQCCADIHRDRARR